MSELSEQTLQENGLLYSTGLYLYEESMEPASKGIRVLASVPDVDAAYRLVDLMGLRTS